MKTIVLLIGLACVAAGLLWIGQGLGVIAWPRESFMINDIEWTWYGAGLALVGAVMIVLSRR
ncbi:hypothetical protein [Hansschlegelia zhihuaiae]|uniref:DUF3995 domain-containing protein n=1 Tax=Hansschlegelia zhihuaiae TaxID=405005 RepID=A0A4Q0MP69_9HYPH|nr:hypothetical protein [Hansschlegelia zhihuaiae]RXF74929.1 hypothetical protein EK403_02385 [Hansschlegelia zhihuaiae]